MRRFFKRHKSLFFYLGAGLFFLSLILIYYFSYLKVGYLFHDYNFFRDYPAYLSPIGGNRWQPLMYYANWMAEYIFHFEPLWPKTFVLFFFWLDLILAFWLLVLITKNKFFSFIAVVLFSVFFRNSPIVYVFSEGCLAAVYPAFFLLGLIIYYYYLKKNEIIYYILPVIIYALSILTMEAAAVFPAVLFLMEIFLNQKFKISTALKRMVPFLIILGSYAGITILTAKNALSISRGEHHLANFSDFSIRLTHLFFAYYPSISFFDINKMPLNDGWGYIFLMFFLLLSLTIIFLFLKVPKYLKFFIVTVWFLLFPFALFETNWEIADRYVFFSGLFVIAFIIMTLKLLADTKKIFAFFVVGICVIILFYQNTFLLRMKIKQWEAAAGLVENVKQELVTNYPVLPQAPVFIIGLPYGYYNAGHPGNFVYFFYNRTWPEYLSFHINPEIAARKYLWLQKCSGSSVLMNNPPHGILYNQGKLEDIDLIPISQRLINDGFVIECDKIPSN